MKNNFTRRDFMKLTGAAAVAASWTPTFGQSTTRPGRTIAPGPFKATWESLVSNYKTPDWFRDAKFGIWAHWTAQCVAEQGDWYARRMYIQGDPAYDYHVKTYGHPSKFGFMEIDNLWKAEKWDPARLMALYKRAGAKYFFALANHHDNLDMYDSTHQAWNSVNVGPKKDIVATWSKLARDNGLRFGVSNHASWANRWLQPAYGYDGEGPLAGKRYDAYTLTKADGKGKWWEGLDPQELYTGNTAKMPDGLNSAAAVRAWYTANTSLARSNPMPSDAFCENWYQRCKELVEKYQPDVLYFDTNELPLEQAGLDVVAHYYNLSAARNGGRADVVVNGKHIQPAHVGAFVEDIERLTANTIRPDPWQTDTCIGDWHYSRAVADENRYATVATIVSMLTDIVSKNGNLMLNIPLRGDGSIDQHEEAFLAGLTAWMDVNSEGIYSTRPWKIYGEGPSTTPPPPPRHACPRAHPGTTVHAPGHSLHHQGRHALRICRSVARIQNRTDQNPRHRLPSIIRRQSHRRFPPWVRRQSELDTGRPGIVGDLAGPATEPTRRHAEDSRCANDVIGGPLDSDFSNKPLRRDNPR